MSHNVALLDSGPGISREALLLLEEAISTMNDPLPGDITSDTFAPGVYARTMRLPKDAVVVGKIHRHAHFNFLLKGVVSVASEFHSETFEAPRMWVSEPGIKRAIHALEDVEWVTIHPNPTDTEDMQIIEESVIANDYEQLDKSLLEGS